MKLEQSFMPSIDQLADQYLSSQNTVNTNKQDAASFSEILSKSRMRQGRRKYPSFQSTR